MAEKELAATGFNPVSLMPQKFGEKYQMAKVLSASGLLPAGLNTPEKVCVALEWGHELQLSPMVAVNNIAVINGKPTLSADIMAAVVKRSPDYAGTEWVRFDDKVAECKVMRRVSGGVVETTHSVFTFEDAVKAGLTSKDVWKKYPRRMLKHRCLSYALRDAFPDILAGLYNPEEMESAGDAEPRNVTPVDIPDTFATHTVPPELAGQVMHEDDMREQMSAHGVPESEPPQMTDAMRLENLLRTYSRQLNDTAQKPTPYEKAYEVLQTGSDGECGDMYIKCVSWLGKKGIKVA